MAPSPRHRAVPTRLGIAAIILTAASLSTFGTGVASAKVAAPQLGFNTYVADTCQTTSAWAHDADAQFPALKALGANSVALAFPLYTNSVTSTSVFARHVCGTGFQTPTPARLAVLITEAHRLGLRVLLRPILDETVLQKAGSWRGAIKPTSLHLWFKNYVTTLTPYLRLAQQYHVEYFAIATEFDSIAKKPNWAGVVSTAKRLYRGRLIFTINWAETASGKVAVAGTSPGIDAYQLAALPNDATPAQLLTAWNNALAHIDTLPFAISAATIDEAGILAQDGAYSQPWQWSLPAGTHPFNENIQANWFSMACSFFRTHRMQGIYYWGVFFASGAQAVLQSPSASDPQAIQPASAAAIKACYTGA